MDDGTARLEPRGADDLQPGTAGAPGHLTTAGGTERSEFSTILVKNAIPVKDIGTTAMLTAVSDEPVNCADRRHQDEEQRDRPMLITQLRVVCRPGSRRPAGGQVVDQCTQRHPPAPRWSSRCRP